MWARKPCTCLVPPKPGEGIGSPGIGVTDSCEPQIRWWGLNLASLEEKLRLLTAEPMLHPGAYIFNTPDPNNRADILARHRAQDLEWASLWCFWSAQLTQKFYTRLEGAGTTRHPCLKTASFNHRLKSHFGRFPSQPSRSKWLAYFWVAGSCGGLRKQRWRRGAAPLSPSGCWMRYESVESDLPRRKHFQIQPSQRGVHLRKIPEGRCTSHCCPRSLSLWTKGLESHEIEVASASVTDVTRGFWMLVKHHWDVKSIGRNSSRRVEASVKVSTLNGPCSDFGYHSICSTGFQCYSLYSTIALEDRHFLYPQREQWALISEDNALTGAS